MSWSDSKVFRRMIANQMAQLPSADVMDFDTDVIKVALYNDSITPDNDVTTDILMGYNGAASQWLTANEQYEAVEWPQGGVALTSKSIDVSVADYVKIDAADTASGSGADLSNVYGCLVYDDDQTDDCGLCYNYFGGANGVTNGTFTVVWHTNGIFRFAL